MKRTQIYWEEEQQQSLQRLAQSHGATVAHGIREAIDAYLVRSREEQDTLLEIIALGASGDAHGSAEHDRDLYDEAL